MLKMNSLFLAILQQTFQHVTLTSRIYYDIVSHRQLIDGGFIMTKLGAFAIGAVVGITAIQLVKTPYFKKACAAVVGKGMQLKDDAAAFAESVKEDAQDIAAEAKYNKENA